MEICPKEPYRRRWSKMRLGSFEEYIPSTWPYPCLSSPISLFHPAVYSF
jgi:hypothetical protein